MPEPVTLYQRTERLTIAKIRRPLSKAAQNLLAKATEMEACNEARDVDDALDTLRLANDPDYLTALAETDGSVPITKAAPAPAPRFGAFDTLSAFAKRLMDTGQAKTFADAVEALGKVRHPAYVAWRGESTPATTPVYKAQSAADDVTRVIKAAQEQDVQLAKRRAAEGELRRRVDRLLKAGAAPNEQEAVRQVFKADVPFYYEHKNATYSTGPMPSAQDDGPRAAPDTPAYALAKRLARELVQNDTWNEYAGMSETEVINQKVFPDNPALYEQVRQEGYSRG